MGFPGVISVYCRTTHADAGFLFTIFIQPMTVVVVWETACS